MKTLDAVLVALVAVLVLGWYLSFTAGRLDRLHHKVTAARAALDVQRVRRCAAAIETAAYLDPASAMLVTDAATAAMAAGEQAETESARAALDPLLPPPWLEATENDVTRALRAAFDDPLVVAADPPAQATDPFAPAADPFAQDAVAVLAEACTRVQLARRFHNDAVAQAQRVRRKRVVRWARLAGRAPMPAMIEFDDTVPEGLTARTR